MIVDTSAVVAVLLEESYAARVRSALTGLDGQTRAMSASSYVELGIVLEEMGRALLAAPFFSTVVLAAKMVPGTPVKMALICSKWSFVSSASSRAMVVLPTPGGPQRIMEDSAPEASIAPMGPSGPSR